MYIKRVSIKNIRSIDSFEMTFDTPAGWHVLIGDNGVGKSTVLRAIAVGLLGPERASMLVTDWQSWVKSGNKKGEIDVVILPDIKVENATLSNQNNKTPTEMPREVNNALVIELDNSSQLYRPRSKSGALSRDSSYQYNWLSHSRWFAAGIGANRRIAGGNSRWNNIESSFQMHVPSRFLTLLNDNTTFDMSVNWLSQLQFRKLEERSLLIDYVIALINSPGLLPANTTLYEVSSSGVVFKQDDGVLIDINSLSDGYKSTLCMLLEILRLLIDGYNKDQYYKNSIPVFEQDADGGVYVAVPGVVLIDEIDAHMHPSWQVRIGSWFRKFFPNIQFIVTSHSPLVCRAAHQGSIWRLTTSGSHSASGEVTGIDREKLISGNILEAYGTEVFGENVVRSATTILEVKRLGELRLKAAFGKATDAEEEERLQLEKIHTTE